MRGQVKKYLPLFQQYINDGRWDQVQFCLKTGKGLKVSLNGKDRREMLQILTEQQELPPMRRYSIDEPTE